jgi:ADP-heptose:LPS heptosyltransferase
MHIAAALGVPFIGITGPSPVSWDPVARSGKVVRADVGCRPCDSSACAKPMGNICIKNIDTETVISEALGILGSKRG